MYVIRAGAEESRDAGDASTPSLTLLSSPLHYLLLSPHSTPPLQLQSIQFLPISYFLPYDMLHHPVN